MSLLLKVKLSTKNSESIINSEELPILWKLDEKSFHTDCTYCQSTSILQPGRYNCRCPLRFREHGCFCWKWQQHLSPYFKPFPGIKTVTPILLMVDIQVPYSLKYLPRVRRWNSTCWSANFLVFQNMLPHLSWLLDFLYSTRGIYLSTSLNTWKNLCSILCPRPTQSAPTEHDVTDKDEVVCKTWACLQLPK